MPNILINIDWKESHFRGFVSEGSVLPSMFYVMLLAPFCVCPLLLFRNFHCSFLIFLCSHPLLIFRFTPCCLAHFTISSFSWSLLPFAIFLCSLLLDYPFHAPCSLDYFRLRYPFFSNHCYILCILTIESEASEARWSINVAPGQCMAYLIVTLWCNLNAKATNKKPHSLWKHPTSYVMGHGTFRS